MTVIFILFFLFTFLLLHSYIIYPLTIKILAELFSKKFNGEINLFPSVSILISAYNEEKVIEKTIRTLLGSDYPLEKIEILVGSDNSTDKTKDVLAKLSLDYKILKIYNFNVRRGKQSVLNDLVKNANGEILIFCDANTIYDKLAVKNLVKNYKDPMVGGVSGKLILSDLEKDKKSGSQEKKYWDAETWLKEQEGKLGILIGANGGIYSIRKEYFENIPVDRPVMDDFYISLKVLEKRKAFLFEGNAFAEEYAAPTIRAEFNRKIRNNSIMMSTIKVIKNMLRPNFGLVSYGLWSHKIIRWFTPVLLLIVFILNFALISVSVFFEYIFVIQLLFYFSAIIGYLLLKLKINIVPFLMIFYFVMTNTAMFLGLIKFLLKKQTSYWQSTPRINE